MSEKMFVKLTTDDKAEIVSMQKSVNLISLIIENMDYYTSFQIGDIVKLNDMTEDYGEVLITPYSITIEKDNTGIDIPALFQVVALDKYNMPILKRIPHIYMDEDFDSDVRSLINVIIYAWDSLEELDDRTIHPGIGRKLIEMCSEFADSTILGTEYVPYESVNIQDMIDEENKRKVLQYFEIKKYNEESKIHFKNESEVITWMKTLKVDDEFWDAENEIQTVSKKYCSRGLNYGIGIYDDGWCDDSITITPDILVGKWLLIKPPKYVPTRPSRDLIARFAPHLLPKERKPNIKKKVK